MVCRTQGISPQSLITTRLSGRRRGRKEEEEEEEEEEEVKCSRSNH